MKTFAAIDQRGVPYLIQGNETPEGYAVVIRQDGPLIGTPTDAKWDGKCNRTSKGVDVTKYMPDHSKGFGVAEAYASISAAAKQE
jgi:hypothetical protein